MWGNKKQAEKVDIKKESKWCPFSGEPCRDNCGLNSDGECAIWVIADKDFC